MTEKEKMLNSELYNSNEPSLFNELLKAKKFVWNIIMYF